MIKNYLKLFDEKLFSFDTHPDFNSNQWNQFLKCFKSIFREIDKEIFQWYFNRGNTFTFLRNEKKHLIGIYGLLNINLNYNGNLIKGFLCHNVGILPQYSGKGLFQYLGDYSISSQVKKHELVLGFPNRASQKGHLRLGWDKFMDVHFLVLNRKDINITLDKKFLIKQVERIEGIDISKFNKQFSFSLNKDLSYIDWRCSRPGEKYFKYVIYDKEENPQGYFIIKYRSDKEEKMHLVDYNFSSFEVLNQIIKFSINLFNKSNCDLFNTWLTKDTAVEKEFFNNGFSLHKEMPSYPIILFQLGNEFDLKQIDKQKVFFTLFDNDVF